MVMFNFLKKRYSLAESGVLSGSVDAHSHILFGVDDGVGHLETSMKILTYEESLGVKEVWCTPHIMEDVPNTTEELQTRFAELQSAYTGPIRLRLAAEYMMDNLFVDRLHSRDLLLHGDNLVLVETSTNNPPLDLDSMLSSIMMAGYTPLLAHPERYRYLQRDDYRLLVAKGVRLQLNLPSLVHYYGDTAYNKANWLLENDMYCAIGSDCHRIKAIQEQYGRRELTSSILKKIETLVSMK